MQKNYEAVLILKPDLAEEERKKLFSQIAEPIAKNNGTIAKQEVWIEKRKLIFPIKKCQEGLYYLLRFSGGPELTAQLNRSYKLNENILRTLIIKLD